MPNGEDKIKELLEKWGVKASGYETQLETSSTQLEEVQARMRRLQPEPVKPEERGILEKLADIAKPLILDWGPLAPSGVKTTQVKKLLKAEMEIVAGNIARYEFYARLYTVVPVGIMGDEISTVEEALAAVTPPLAMSGSEISEVRGIVQDMLEGMELPEPEEGEEVVPPGLPPLVKPTAVVVAPTGIQQLTVNAIVQYLTAPDVPAPTLASAEWDELLTKTHPEYADMSQVEIVQAEARRIIAESKLANEKMAGFQSAVAEMPDYELSDFLLESIMQPGLAMLEVAGIYFEKVSMPIAASVYKVFISDIETLYQQYRIEGDDNWTALQKSWEAWDAPGGGVPEFLLKYMFMEMLVDPLSWLAIFTLGTSMVAATTGRFAKFAGILNKANRVIFAPFEVPFDAIKTVIGKLPKTISQRAMIVEGATGRVVKAYMERFSKGKLLNKGMTIRDWDKLAKRAVRYAFNNPQSTDDIAETGRVLLKHKPISRNEYAEIGKRLGVVITPEDVSPQMLADINTVFEAMFQKYGARKGMLMTAKEAAKRTLEIFSLGGADDKVANKAVGILERRAKRIVAEAYSFGKAESPGKALQQLMKRNFDYHIAIERAIEEMVVSKSTRFTQLYAGIEAKFVAIWQKYVEEIAIRPLAQSYLTFAMYGPMNVIEDHWRSILGGVFPRRMTVARMSELSHGLHIDPDLVNPALAVSEAIGRMARHGGDDQWNNWILQLATLGQKDWADKLYTGLVRLPGGFGMDLRRNFVGQKYLVLFKEMGGETAEMVLKAEARAPALADKKLVKELQNAIYDAKTTLDIDRIRDVENLFTRKSIYRREVQSIMKEHPELPNSVRDFLVESFDDNTLYVSGVRSVNAKMKQANIRLVDDYLKGAEHATKQFQELVDVLSQMEVRNPEEMAHLLLNLNYASDIYGKAPEEILAQATIASQGQKLAERRARFDKVFDDILEFRDKAGGNLEKLVEKLRVDLKAGRTFNDEYTTKSDRLLDLIIAKKALSDQFRLEDMAWRHELFAGVEAKEMTNEWWQSTYRQMNQRISENKAKMVGIEGDIILASKEVDLAGGIQAFSRQPIKVVGRALAPQDIASIVGAQGDDLSRALLDNLTIVNDRDMFVEFVTRQLRPGDEGFTREAIGEVFDQIARQARVKPGAINWVTSKQMELEAVRGDLHQLYHSKLLPDSEIKEIGRYVDETAEVVDRLVYEERVVTKKIPDYDIGLGEQVLKVEPGFVGKPAVAQDAEYINRIRTELTKAAEDTRLIITEVDKKRWMAEGRPIPEGKTLRYATDMWFATSDNEALQVIGRTASGSPEYLAKVRGILKKKYPSGYIRIYRGTGKASTKELGALEREFTNVTSSRKTALDFEDTWTPGEHAAELRTGAKPPDIDDVLIRVDDVVAIAAVEESELIIPTRLLRKHIEKPLKAPVKLGPKVVKSEFEGLQEIRQQAMDEAHKWYYKEFTDYTNGNAFDMLLKGIYPFWNYESQRWFWLPRSFVRHPGTFTQMERWQDNTDYGYVPIPGTSIEINPFRGTIYGPLTTRLTRRDYPEYYDAWEGAEPINEYFDWLSRYGFYLGGHLTIPMSLFGGLEAQTGEALPPIWESPLMVLQAIAPESDAVKMLTDHIFSDRFRTYMTIQEVIARGGDGVVISAKMQRNEPLTDEEQALWDGARRSAAGFSLLFENTGLFRLRHPEKRAVYEAATKYIEEKYGYTEDQQKWLRMHGHRIWDQIGGMSLDDQRILEELEYFRYTGTIDRLLPGRQQLVLDKLTISWNKVEKFVDTTIERKLLLEREFQSGVRGPDDYQKQLRELYDEQSQFIYDEMKDNLDEPLPEGLTKEDERAFVKEHSVMELEGRKRYYEKWGIPLPVLHPLKELLNLYHSIELKEAIDTETGELVRDWDTFWTQRQAVEDAVPDMWKGEFDTYITKNETRLESIRRQVYQTYFNKYWWIYDQVLKGYNDRERKLIREYISLEKRGVNLARQAEIQSMPSEKTGNLIISSFRSDISEARQALRYANPTLDAWLFYWGRVGTFLTPQAEEIYYRIAKETGRAV